MKKLFGVPRTILRHLVKKRLFQITDLQLIHELQAADPKFPVSQFNRAMNALQEDGYVQMRNVIAEDTIKYRVELTTSGETYFHTEKDERWALILMYVLLPTLAALLTVLFTPFALKLFR